MAGNLKKIFIIGNLGSDPTIRMTQNVVPVASFNVAVNERRRAQSGDAAQGGANAQAEQTTWFRITAWRQQAEFAERFLKKGMTVFVSGDLRTSEFTGNDGKNRTTLEVTADDLQILTPKGMTEGGDQTFSGGGQSYGGGNRQGGGQSSSGGRQQAPASDTGFDDEGDIPF